MRLHPVSLAKNFLEILKVREFRVYSIAGALSFSGLFVYLTGSPSIFIEGFGLTKQEYSYIFAFLAVAMIGGGQLNNQLIKRRPSDTIFKISIIAQVLLSVSFLIAILTMNLGLVVTIGSLFFILLSVGIAYPNAASLAMASFSKNAGSASALLGFIQMGMGAVLASLVGLLNVGGTLPTALVISLSSILAWIILKFD
jgi:DHA1 family bicyclomycin/chloramphenicol resistance-like MFS transporter